MKSFTFGFCSALGLTLAAPLALAQDAQGQQPMTEQPMEQPQQAQQPMEQPQQAQGQQQQQAQPQGRSDDVTLNQLPAAVRQTVEREVANGRIEDIERDTERGKTVYEIEFIRDNIEYEIDVGEDGALLERFED